MTGSTGNPREEFGVTLKDGIEISIGEAESRGFVIQEEITKSVAILSGPKAKSQK